MLSPSVVKFFNMSEHDPALLSKTNPKTPKTTTKNHRNNSKNKQTASTSSPKPNRHNKLPHKNNNTNTASQQPTKVVGNGTGARQAPRKDRTNNNRTGNLGNKPPQHRQNCRQQQHNESNHSDSSLSVSSKTSSSNKQSGNSMTGSTNTSKTFVKLATLTNKSDSDSGNNYPQHGYNTRAKSSYRNRATQNPHHHGNRQRNDESFSFDNVAPNSELFAGSSSAPDAKSLPPPPSAWLSSFNVPKNIKNNNRAPKIETKTINNDQINGTTSPTQLRPTVQNLFASMSLVQASA